MQQQALGALNGHVAEICGGHHHHGFGHEQRSIATFDALNAKCTTAWRAQFVSGIIIRR
jgi:hypothetical protein